MPIDQPLEMMWCMLTAPHAELTESRAMREGVDRATGRMLGELPREEAEDLCLSLFLGNIQVGDGQTHARLGNHCEERRP